MGHPPEFAPAADPPHVTPSPCRRHPGGACRRCYARLPSNGKLPNMPVSAVPLIASPSTLPLKVKVSGIGLVTDTFHETVLPFTEPSAMSVVLPSASCVPVSTPPAATS